MRNGLGDIIIISNWRLTSKQMINNAIDSILSNSQRIKYSKSFGVDGINGEMFIKNLENERLNIKSKIDKGYRFSNYREKLLIKKHNSTRRISIPTQRDKIVLRALLNILRSRFKIHGNNIKTKIVDIKKNIGNFNYFIKVDIKDFYPSINHKILLNIIRTQMDSQVFNMIKLAISQPTVDIKTPRKNRNTQINTKGVPQGLSISGFLSDIYLKNIDEKYINNPNIKYYRFVDDILILCNKDNIDSIKEEIKNCFEKVELNIHSFSDNQNKSSSGCIKDGFQYLGYRFTDTLVSVRQASVNKFYNKINKHFIIYANNGNTASTDDFIHGLNALITGIDYEGKKYGWINFFSEINDMKLLFSIDNYIKKMLNKRSISGTTGMVLPPCMIKRNEERAKAKALVNDVRVKKISRAIFEIRKTKSNYITRDVTTEALIDEIEESYY